MIAESSKILVNKFIDCKHVFRNLSVAEIYEKAFLIGNSDLLSNVGALMSKSGLKTGRSPLDKRIVFNSESAANIWWGDVNMKITEEVFMFNLNTAINFFNTKEHLFVVDGFANWDLPNRIKIRVICTRAYHALFMTNMLIMPSPEELKLYGEPDYTIFNAGECLADSRLNGNSSNTSINISFEHRIMVILGTEYAGEMKKGVFTIMNYLMPLKSYLSMHCSANEGDDGDTSLYFGLSGTGKTTLSADEKRKLIGDDEHIWTNKGISNIEGGCYAKTINLNQDKEPTIYNAIKFGTVLENVVFNEDTREVDYNNISITENTRASYPINFIKNAKIPCIGNHPKNIIFLTCDAFGVLPPVSKLTIEQAMYHFISGYTAKIAGTEMGVVEPKATFSACFGAAFLVWHPIKYAELLADKIKKYNTNVWMVNTGWIGGPVGVGKRISLEFTRAIIDAINDGSLNNSKFMVEPFFNFKIPISCLNVPNDILNQYNCWGDKSTYRNQMETLVCLFQSNFEKYKDSCSLDIINAGPRIGKNVIY